MSQQKVFAVSADTSRRISVDGSTHQGCGLSKHLYVGRQGSFDYDAYIKFTLDWTNVGRIVSATLNVYTDEYNNLGPAGEIGIFTPPGASDKPTVSVYRLDSAFTEGSNADGNFTNGDYTNPTRSSTGAKLAVLTSGADLLKTINITDIVRAWAPATVEGGGRRTNHGIGLYGKQDSTKNWSGWSKKHTGGGGAAERPSITLVYEYGETVPNVPSNLVPSGNVASLATFEGDFTDVRTTDKLQSTSIEIYDAAHAADAALSGNLITSNPSTTKHGLIAGNAVYFTSVGTSGLSAFARYFVLAAGLTTTAFKVATTKTGSPFSIVADSAVTWSRQTGVLSGVASQSQRTAAHFIVTKPATLPIITARTYRWRARVTDNEGQTSAWTTLVSFVLTNTVPATPTLKPISGASFASLNLVKFEGGTFSDPDSGDKLGSHQVQLSPFANGNIGWTEADGILWDTGQRYDSLGSLRWVEYYGGEALAAGTYYWRARQWDTRQGVSAWSAAIPIVLTAAFSPDPANYDSVQVNPKAPWRIKIFNLLQADGVTPTTGRAPGQLIAVFEEAKNIGASVVYNSPGELHFTLLKDDPQLGVVEPKQTHYAVELYSGDGWQEKYAGVIWDVDATETDVVFKGIDYLALYDTVIDERYDPLKPDRSYSASPSGSFYSNVTIRTVVMDQLNRAKALTDSWVGFITIGTVDAMDEMVTVYSTMQPVLSFVAGMIDSHRQGTGKRTRMKVVKTTTGTYQLLIVDDPGVIRTDLAMYYGELVQGYRVIVFGDGWANVQHIVGRNRDGVKVVYQTISGKAFQPSTSVYGRIATVAVMDGVQDQNDLTRRGLQAAIQNAKFGKHVAIGIRTEHLAPLQGWDVCDIFPLRIKDGAIDTDRFGSGFWASYAAAWEVTDIGEQSLVITFMPREDSVAPDVDLIPSLPHLSPQSEWQLSWVPPNPITATSLYWYDIATGLTYVRQGDGTYVRMENDPKNNNQISNSGFEMNPIATTLTKKWDVTTDWDDATSQTNLNVLGGSLAMTTATY